MGIIFWLSISVIPYVYVGYLLMLKLKQVLCGEMQDEDIARGGATSEFFPRVSVIVAAFNEQRTIKERIDDLLNLDYPRDKSEIIVASDGSTDRTVPVARMYENEGVIILDHEVNRGRAAVQNDAIGAANGEICVFTDAKTRFEKDCLYNISRRFFDQSVGCVVGNLIYKTKGDSISESERFYWTFEKKIRQVESNLGILASATGACMAIRRNLWKELGATDDCDFTSPLDVILQGYRVIYAPDAIAYDVPPSTLLGEFMARVRQTSKNLVGTLRRWGWKGWIKHPLVSWGLLSHKILRWFSPFFIIAAFVSNFFLASKNTFYQITFLAQLAFYAVGFLGLVGEVRGKRVPVASSVLAFCVAAAGMGIGVIKGLVGKAPAVYKSE